MKKKKKAQKRETRGARLGSDGEWIYITEIEYNIDIVNLRKHTTPRLLTKTWDHSRVGACGYLDATAPVRHGASCLR